MDLRNVDEPVVDAKKEKPLEPYPEMIPKGIPEIFPGKKAVEQKDTRGKAEPVYHGNQGIHRTELKSDGNPGGPPDKRCGDVHESVLHNGPFSFGLSPLAE